MTRREDYYYGNNFVEIKMLKPKNYDDYKTKYPKTNHK
jgi:hypothetical protein